MRTKIKRLTATLLAVLSLFSLTGCGEDVPDDGYIDAVNPGKEIVQTAAADAVFSLNSNSRYSMNPLIATNTSNQIICCLVYENMLELDSKYELVPNLITAWEASNGGKTWSFTVTEGRTFHDGSPLTAWDVAFSLKCAMNSDRFRSRFSYVYGVSALDDTSFVVNLGKSNMQFPKLLTVPVIKSGTFDTDHPVGSGPYTYAEDHKSLTAFKEHPSYATLPLDTIYIKEYTTIDEIITAFEDSVLDLVMNDPTATTNLGYGSSNEIRGYNTTNLHYIGFNTESPLFMYDGMRYALNYAFDRDYIVDQFNGFALGTSIAVSPASPYYSKTLAEKYYYDLNQCGNILRNGGLSDFDNDGFLEQKIGDTLIEIDVRFVVCSASVIKVTIARKFAADMARLGLKVTVQELNWSDYKAAVNNGNFDMYYGEVRENPDFDPSKFLVEDAILNYGKVESEELERAIGEYLAADDDNRPGACYNMCSAIAAQAFMIPLCYEKHQMITHRGIITGISITENNPLYNFANWTVDLGTGSNEIMG